MESVKCFLLTFKIIHFTNLNYDSNNSTARNLKVFDNQRKY